MKNLTYLFVLLVVMFASGAQADTVGSMTTFSAGTPAVASDVNGNFNAVATAVNGNDTLISTNTGSINNLSGVVNGNTVGVASNANAINAIDTTGIATNTTAITNLSNGQVNTNAINIGINDTNVANNTNRLDTLEAAPTPTTKAWKLVDGNGTDLGTIIGASVSGIATVSYISDKGYIRSSVSMLTGSDSSATTFFYIQNNCLGIPFGQIPPNVVIAIADGSPSTALYYATGANVISAMSSFRTTTGVCLSTVKNGTFRAIAPNDPTVTGITDSVLTTPLIPTFK